MKEESGFGFKDKAKAEETLKLLEEHDPGYRRLTVRGLLGRAKRVLSLTKAEDKIKNIKEAMEVFENWLAELEKNKDKKPDTKKKDDKKTDTNKKDVKKGSSDEEAGPSEKTELPPEGVQGLGFKDPGAARATLEALSGRDPDYQILAVRGLLGRARRVVTLTKDETKLADIKSAIDILEQFTREYETKGLAAKNNPWLPLSYVRTAHQLAKDSVTQQQSAFLAAYVSVRGEYKRLRNVTSDSGDTWDRIRNKVLADIKEKHASAYLFTEKEEPTKEHLEMLVWAYSPDANRTKKLLKETEDEEKSDKMEHDGDETNEDGDSIKEKNNGKKRDDDRKKDDREGRRSSEKSDNSNNKDRGGRRSSEKNDRKRRSSAKSDDESHSKKKRE